MAYVVGDPCIRCKHTDCVAVCPVDCFYQGENMLVINPDECIDCGACDPECPSTAIFAESELPARWEVYKSINAVFSGSKKIQEVDTTHWPVQLKSAPSKVWPSITEQKDALPGAAAAEKETNKLGSVSGNPGSD